MTKNGDVPYMLLDNCDGPLRGIGSFRNYRAVKNDTVKDARRLYCNQDKVTTRKGRWEIWSRRGFQIHYFDEEGDTSDIVKNVDGQEIRFQPDGFAAFYFDDRAKKPDGGKATEPRTVVIGKLEPMGQIEEDLKRFADVLEAPLTGSVLRRMPITVAGTIGIIGACIGRYASPEVVPSGAFGITVITTIGCSFLGGEHNVPFKNSRTGYLIDSVATINWPDRVKGYRYGSEAQDAIIMEASIVKDELVKAALFERWKRADLGEDKKQFLFAYDRLFDTLFKYHTKKQSEEIRLSGNLEGLGKVIRVFEQPVEV